MLLTLLALLGSGCAESGLRAAASQPATAPGKLTAGRFAGTAASPSKPAPPLRLHSALGKQVDIDHYRGKAVLVTFIFTQCPDICPLIVSNLRAVQGELGREAGDLQIIAVSVDPDGDTPVGVAGFLRARLMTGQMEYLIGSRPELEQVWSDWGVVSKASPKKHDREFLEHTALVYGISAGGRITTLYPAQFDPAQIAHDVPILASE